MKTIRLHAVSDALHDRLKVLAAAAGLSVSDYLLSELHRIAEEPTAEEIQARLRILSEMEPSEAPTKDIRA